MSPAPLRRGRHAEAKARDDGTSLHLAMLENGADVRMIQAILGHVKLTTTEIYTHVAITKLKEIHTATHPAARLGPAPKGPSA